MKTIPIYRKNKTLNCGIYAVAISSLQEKTAVESKLEKKKFVFLFFAKLLFAPSKTNPATDKFRVNPRGIMSLKKKKYLL
jgi:hypothetical protein